VLHVHPVLGFATPTERHAAHLYARYLQQFASHYGFGFTERRLRKLSAKAAAAYLSAYFVTGKRGKESLHESVRAPDMPRSIIHVSTELTQRSGVTMRELRFRRFVWFIARAAGTSLQEARHIAVEAIAGTLDLSVDSFLPSPRRLAQILGREPPSAMRTDHRRLNARPPARFTRLRGSVTWVPLRRRAGGVRTLLDPSRDL
jgi:hypothetical protein